jgi:ATP-dependent helicase/nuclease subunit A
LIVRIREVLEKELKKSELSKDDSKKIEHALATLAYAKISTFHSFCYDLLREYPIEFNVDPDAEIGDERGQDSIYQACFQQLCENLRFIDGHNREKDLKIFEEFISLTEEKKALEFFVTLFSNRDLKCKEVPLSNDRPTILAEMKTYFREFISLMEQIDSEVKKDSDTLYVNYQQTIKPYINQFENPEELYLDYLESSKVPFKKAGNKANYKDKDYIPKVKIAMEAMEDCWETYQSVNEILCYNLGVKSFPYFCELVEEHKKNYGILDFFDCLYKVKTGLEKNISLRKLIQNRFDIVTVDEFQDSDPMQAQIAFMLAEDDPTKLFFVGDPKQSIYGFARADISVYQSVMDKVEGMDKGQVLNLSTNFRSSPEILKFINHNFEKILKRDKSYPEMTVGYDQMDVCPENESLKGSVSKWILEMETGEKIKADEWRERESFSIAMKIKEMLTNGYSAGDFLILFRTGTSMRSYEDALLKLKIPVINTKSKDFLSKIEVIDMLNIIAHVAFPKDAFFKASAENSVLFKEISASSLVAILDSDLSLLLKLEEVFDICGLKEASLQRGDDLLLQLKINLMSLLEVELDATKYDLKESISNLFEKATNDGFFNSIKLNDESIYVEARSPNAVRLMTIHAAKGLESKVVILSAHGQTRDMGGCHFIDRNDSTFYPNCSMLSSNAIEILELSNLQEKLDYLEIKTAEEEKRVLYVAATRAIETLIILTKEGDSSKFMAPLMTLEGLNFTNIETVSFANFQEEFDRHLIFIKSDLQKIVSVFNPEAMKKIEEDKYILYWAI